MSSVNTLFGKRERGTHEKSPTSDDAATNTATAGKPFNGSAAVPNDASTRYAHVSTTVSTGDESVTPIDDRSGAENAVATNAAPANTASSGGRDPQRQGRYIDDPDGQTTAKLGDALRALIEEGLGTGRKTQTELLQPHRATLLQLRRQGATNAQIAAAVSEKMGMTISERAVAKVLAPSAKAKKRGRAKASAVDTDAVDS